MPSGGHLEILQPFLAIYGCLSTRFDRKGSRMGSAEAKVTPEGWPVGNDVYRCCTQYKLIICTPKRGLKFDQNAWPTQKSMGKLRKRCFCMFSAPLSMIPGLVCAQIFLLRHNRIYCVWLSATVLVVCHGAATTLPPVMLLPCGCSSCCCHMAEYHASGCYS